MGNCQQQFSNIPELEDQWQNKERVDISMISRLHMTIKPQTNEQLKIGAIQSEYVGKQIDNQRLYDTKAINYDRSVTINKPKIENPVEKKKVPEIEILDLNFYRSLGLQEYSYLPLGRQFQKLDINENISIEGIKYVGQWKNDKAHGNGVLTSDTKKYIGQFLNGLKHFHGREIQKREVYEGEFQYHRRKGRGKLYKQDRIEEGQFDDIFKQGKIVYKNGNQYEGPILNGEYHGKNCKFYDASSKIHYQGQFQNGKMTGFGILTYPDNQRYEGDLIDGSKHGYGKFQWNSQTFYVGYYYCDQKHGQGELRINGQTLKGNFKNGLLDGDVIVEEGMSKTTKRYLYGRQVIQEIHITQEGLPEHWKP